MVGEEIEWKFVCRINSFIFCRFYFKAPSWTCCWIRFFYILMFLIENIQSIFEFNTDFVLVQTGKGSTMLIHGLVCTLKPMASCWL
jgi:hypothetical protein